MPPDNHTFVGRSLGRYQLVRVLGRGAMGVVYEGLDTRLARTVAVKTVQRSFLADEATAADYAARFEREAQAAARLHHPHIVTLFDFGEQDDVSYIVMEFIRGRELAQAFRDGERFTLPQVQRLMAELLDALGAAHEHGIVHRDVKPANVLIDDQGRVKLADFGVARVVDGSQDRTMPGTMVGTPSAMAPEQILGLSVGSRTDIFSAGLICYQLLTGQRPFAGSGPFGVQRAIVHDEPQPPSALNPELTAAVDAVVARALAKKPEHRYETAAAFSAALTAALAPVARATAVAAETPVAAAVASAEAAAADLDLDLDLDTTRIATPGPALVRAGGQSPLTALASTVPTPPSAAPAAPGPVLPLPVAPRPAPAGQPAAAAAPSAGLSPAPAAASPAPTARQAPVHAGPLRVEVPRRWAVPLGLALAAVVLVGAGAWALRPRAAPPAAAALHAPAAQPQAPTAQAPAPGVAPDLVPAAAPIAPAPTVVTPPAPAVAAPGPGPTTTASGQQGSAATRPAAGAAAARPALARTADHQPRPPADPRCADLLSRIQLGDSLTPEQTTLFHTRCAR